MIFLFPKKKIVLDCFTSRPEVFEFSPITNAIKYIPDWWRKLPNNKVCFKNIDDNETTTMKHCIGFIDLFKNSFVVPMWSDLNLQIGVIGTNDYRWQYSDECSSISVHSAKERGTYLDEKEYQHFKLNTPWSFKSNKYVKFFWSGASWNMEKPEQIIWLPAIDNYYYQTSATINFMCKREKSIKEFLIPFGQPLVYLTPLTENEVVLKNHLVTDLELNNINKRTFFRSSFIKPYLKLKRMK